MTHAMISTSKTDIVYSALDCGSVNDLKKSKA